MSRPNELFARAEKKTLPCENRFFRKEFFWLKICSLTLQTCINLIKIYLEEKSSESWVRELRAGRSGFRSDDFHSIFGLHFEFFSLHSHFFSYQFSEEDLRFSLITLSENWLGQIDRLSEKKWPHTSCLGVFRSPTQLPSLTPPCEVFFLVFRHQNIILLI